MIRGHIMKLLNINNYWLHRFSHLEEDYPTCFICGKDKHLERCHLIPRALGGTYEVDNLVLLCNEHHKQAPNTSLSKDIMLNWIEEESSNYDHFFHMRNEDVVDMYTSITAIGSRLIDELGEDVDMQNIVEFLLDKHRHTCLYVGSHSNANIRTKILFLNYMSRYSKLEIDYLKYLIINNKSL